MNKYGIDWEDRSIILRNLGLAVAPELFTVQKMMYLTSGTTILQGTKYFTWNTARELIHYRKVPKGWRLPTAEEAEAICKSLLSLELNGFVCADRMAEYCRHPESSDDLIVSGGKVGYYWTSDLKAPSYPYAIFSSELSMAGSISIHYSYGLSMLLVKKM